jgi:hypothetical protein
MPKPDRKLFKPDSWPGGHRAALAIVVDLDPEDSPWALPSPLANEAAAERLVAMMADLDIAPTVVVDPQADDQFRLPAGMQYDTAAHIFEMPADLSEARSSCKTRLGKEPRGVIMLAGLPTLTLEKQDLWFIDGSGAPYPEITPRNRIVIPYSPYWHDATWLTTASPSPPSAFLEHISLSLSSVRTRGELMTLFLTAQIAGHPGHLETVQRFLDEAIGAGDVWITNASGIADYASTSHTS